MLQLRPIGLVEAEELADHHCGERSSDVVDDFGRTAFVANGVKDSGDLCANVVFPCACSAWSEPTRNHVAALHVERVVKADDGIVGREVRPIAALFLVGVDEDVLALFDLDDVVVARDSPQLVDFVPVDRFVGTHPRVRGIRVAAVQLRGEKIYCEPFHGPSKAMNSTNRLCSPDGIAVCGSICPRVRAIA